MVDHIFHDRHKALHRHCLDAIRVVAVVIPDIYKCIIHIRIIRRDKRTPVFPVDALCQDVLDNETAKIYQLGIMRIDQPVGGYPFDSWKCCG